MLIYFLFDFFFRIPIDPESFSNQHPPKWADAVAEPTNRKAFAATLEYMSMLEKFSYRNGKTSIEVSDFNLQPQTITFPIRSHSPFCGEFQEKIQRLLEAGICPHRLAKKLFPKPEKRYKMNKMYDEEIPALVLSMDDLGVGFEICSIPLVLSVAIFIYEIGRPLAKKFFDEYIVPLFVVFAFIGTEKPGI